MGSNKVIKMQEGARYGSWTVKSFSHHHPKSRNAYWNVTCVCGTESSVSGSNLRRGDSTQCKSCQGRDNQRSMQYAGSEGKDLYMVRVIGKPIIKIGSTSNIKNRLVQLRAYNHEEIELVGLWEGEGGREEEWHKALYPNRIRGEWFNFAGRAD